MSIDNLFIFLLIFKKLRIQPIFQHRVLFWGVLGAFFFRFVAILSGIEILEKFWWSTYAFGGLLIFSGAHLMRAQNNNAPSFMTFSSFERKFSSCQDGRFFVWDKAKLKGTVLLLALLYVELSDILFAFDSVPAALAITKDFKFVYTANVMAILGLRSLYGWLAQTIIRFPGLHRGLGSTLLFIGIKMAVSPHYEFPLSLSLSTIIVLLVGSMLWHRRNNANTR